MRVLVWTALFLLLAVAGSAVGAAGMLGMPISSGIGSGLFVVSVLLAVWGIILIAAKPRHAPTLVPITPTRRPHAPSQNGCSI